MGSSVALKGITKMADRIVIKMDAKSENEHERQQAVWKALGELDAKYRMIITQYYLGGYTALEISRMYCLSLSSVESRLRRAKTMLKKELFELSEQSMKEQNGDFLAARLRQTVPAIFLVQSRQWTKEYGFTKEGDGGSHPPIGCFITYSKDVQPFQRKRRGHRK